MSPTALRIATATAVLDAVAAAHGIDTRHRGGPTALAGAAGITPQELSKARAGLRSVEWLVMLGLRHGMGVSVWADGRVEVTP